MTTPTNSACVDGVLLLDVSLRFPAITILLLIAVFCLRDARHLLQARIAALLCVSLASMIINTMPEALELPGPVSLIAWLLHIPNTVFLWWFGLSLFEDEFRLRPIHWAGLAVAVCAMVILRLAANYDHGLLFGLALICNRIAAGLMMGHLIWTALSGRGDDLIESRRRTRVWFTVGVAVTASLIISLETGQYLVTGHDDHSGWVSTLRVGIALPMILFGTFWFAAIQPERFVFERVKPKKPTAAKIDPRDAPTHARLVAAMEQDHLYREQGLSIGDVAARLSVPEHQLRSLINQGLGYRNFSAFLNQYRLADAKAQLADPDTARRPVLTIAMDVGYASLATFNRAFKTAEGMTPTEYRSNALGGAAQS